jgi:hypothetical protein
VLFVRTNRRLALTEAGRLLLPRARATLAAADDAVDAVRDGRLEAGHGGAAGRGPRARRDGADLVAEVVYASADASRTARPVTIERLAPGG